MAAALALSERGRGRTAPNPNVGCVIVRDGRVIGRGWTQPGGRPHAEAMALAEAGEVSGATVYVTLEPCAHESARGPACAATLAAGRPARLVIAIRDPDPRTDGRGATLLRETGVTVVEDFAPAAARAAMPGFFSMVERGRPHVTLKLATSLDGRIALPSGESRWITGPEARAHAHLERARADAILVGRGTFAVDMPKLDVRLPGLEGRGPLRVVLSSSAPTDPFVSSSVEPAETRPSRQALGGTQGSRQDRTKRGGRDEAAWRHIRSPHAIAALPDIHHLLVEGGAATAAAFLGAGLVDRLLLYRAPILLGAGRAALDDIGLAALADAHGRWRLEDARTLGIDRLEVYAPG